MSGDAQGIQGIYVRNCAICAAQSVSVFLQVLLPTKPSALVIETGRTTRVETSALNFTYNLAQLLTYQR